MAKPPITFSTAFTEYALGKQIDVGGSGYVYAARSTDGGEVAIKILNPALVTTQKRKRFKNEIGFCSTERHPAILRILDWGVATSDFGGAPFYVMPRYAMTMRALLAKPMTGESALKFFDQVLAGLQVAHGAGVIHRDLKPENILYAADQGQPVIADFGIAHFTEDALITAVETRKTDRLANFVYCAPEQRAKGQRIDRSADIFALGLMLNEAMTGHVPHGVDYSRIAQVATRFAFLDDVVTKAIQSNPDNRYSSAEDMRTDIYIRAKHAGDSMALEQLRAATIPDQDWADKIVKNPITIVKTESDWQNNRLILKLSQTPTGHWITCFRHVGHSGRTDFLADQWDISGDRASVGCRETDIRAAMDQFATFLEATASMYKRELEGAARQKRLAQEDALRKKIEAEEARQRALKLLHGST